MALKDTLEKRRDEMALAQAFDKEAIIVEWQTAVSALMSSIEQFLEEYKNAGTLQIERGDMQVTEETLGTYQVPQMTLRAGSAALMIQPIGRVIIGATGRVDLYRQGRGAKNERVMALRNVACTRFRRHRVRCFDGTGGVSWRGGSLHASSSLRLCG